jgi:hypothetical protein
MAPAHRRMLPVPAQRASDEERERTVERLRNHYAAGRMEAHELEERIERAYGATTRGELWAVQLDLPRIASRRGVMARIERVNRAALRLHAAAYGTVNGSLIGVWALTGEGSFWPAWALVPGTALLAWHVAGTRRMARARRASGNGGPPGRHLYG